MPPHATPLPVSQRQASRCFYCRDGAAPTLPTLPALIFAIIELLMPPVCRFEAMMKKRFERLRRRITARDVEPHSPLFAASMTPPRHERAIDFAIRRLRRLLSPCCR